MNVYPGPELMGHPDLQVDLSSFEPLITSESLKDLENAYLDVSVVISNDSYAWVYMNKMLMS